MARRLRGLVSKKKKRFQEDGFDLDLTYVTPKLIAMGFPSVGAEAAYRNPLPEVQRFFRERHDGHYKIYNLCSERAYEIKDSFPLVERYPFDDHNPCHLEMIPKFCADVDEFLKDPDNVVGIHCKAGKGRTGCMIAAYLVHTGMTAVDALQHFGHARTHNAKGVTIPSQMRYVHYYEQYLKHGPPEVHTYQITHIRLITVPNFDVGGGCDPYFQVRVDGKKIYDYRKHVKRIKHCKKERFVDLDVSTHNLRVRNNVKLLFFDQDAMSADDKMFHVWFHTGYIENNYLCFQKSVLDKACKDKKNRHFRPGFKLEIFLHKVEGDAKEFEDAKAVDDEADPDGDDTADEDEESKA